MKKLIYVIVMALSLSGVFASAQGEPQAAPPAANETQPGNPEPSREQIRHERREKRHERREKRKEHREERRERRQERRKTN